MCVFIKHAVMLSSIAIKRPSKFLFMGILRAIGFGIGLIILRVLMPDVFSGLESALVKFFSVLTEIMGKFPNSADQTASILPHAVFPQ